jgi:hypothetical protein
MLCSAYGLYSCILEQTATFAVYIINWLVSVTEQECVYCAVQNGSVGRVNVKLSMAVMFRVLIGISFE